MASPVLLSAIFTVVLGTALALLAGLLRLPLHLIHAYAVAAVIVSSMSLLGWVADRRRGTAPHNK